MKKNIKNKKNSNLIALIAPFFDSPFVNEVAESVIKKLIGTIYTPVQYSTKGILDNEKNILQKILKSNMADAFIFFNIPVDKDVLKEIKSQKIPVVSLEKAIPGYVCITSDNFKGGYIGTEYLIKKGLKKIALVIGERYVLDTVQNERIKGYMTALYNNKIEFRNEFIKIIAKHSFEGGVEIAKEFYSEKELYDGVFCLAGDVVAMGIIKGMQDNNIKIPEEFAVVGYDDLKIASYFFKPKLTTIKQNTQKMGEMAVELILNFLEGKKIKPEKKIIIAPELIIRESA